MSLFAELRQRSVFRVGLTYLAVAWVVLQIVSSLIPIVEAPLWIGKAILLLLVAGFPVSLVLAWAYELTPDGLKRTPPTTAAEPSPPRHRLGRKWDFVVIGVLTVALGHFAWDRYGAARNDRVADRSGAESVTLAVLPFEDLSPNRDQGYFADGIAEELLNSLARVKGLQVTARTSSFYFKGKNEDIRTIGQALDVENLLEGSVRRDGDRIRITTQLINAETGYHLWSKTYDRNLTDIFALQDEIATAVGTALQVTLGVGYIGRIPGMTRNAEAFEEYLQGNELARRFTRDSVQQAAEHYDRAVALDPSFSVAWIAMASNYYGGAQLFPEKLDEWHQRVEVAFNHAQQANPEAPDVLFGVASNDMGQGKWREAGDIYAALPGILAKYGLDNYLAGARGGFLLVVGQVRDAIPVIESVRAISPLDANVTLAVANAYAIAGKTEDARDLLARAGTLGASPLVVNGFEFLLGIAVDDKDEIRRVVGETQVLLSNIAPGAGGENVNVTMVRFLDTPLAAEGEIRRLADSDLPRRNPRSLLFLATWAAYYKQPELALDLQRKYIETNIDLAGAMQTLWRPLFSEVRKLPSFRDLVREQGLIEYWRAYGWPDACHAVGSDDFECS